MDLFYMMGPFDGAGKNCKGKAFMPGVELG